MSTSRFAVTNDAAFIARVSSFNRRAESKLRRSLFAATKANAGTPSEHFRFTFAPGVDAATVNERLERLVAAGAAAHQVELPGELGAVAEVR
ncbi:MAG: hypothetical protein OEW52_00270 [Thermoleophilia bacterium]|nr:hypothetical protein [Thermoleophilia bacterium]